MGPLSNVTIDHVFRSLHSRRIDFRMLPLLGLLYAIALIDRTNLSIARTAGMDRDLVCPSSFASVSSKELLKGLA